jgi:hypothetical protein
MLLMAVGAQGSLGSGVFDCAVAAGLIQEVIPISNPLHTIPTTRFIMLLLLILLLYLLFYLFRA